MNFYFIVYFLVGLVQDLLFTLNIRFISKDKVWPAVVTSFIATVIGLLVFYDIFTRLDRLQSIPAILFYAGGVAIGTFLAMKFRFVSKKSSKES